MNEFIFTIVGGVIVAIIVSWFGIGGTKHVTVHGTTVRKTGKWMIFFAVLMIFGGLAWAGQSNTAGSPTIYGYTVAGYGLILLMIGKVVAWFQRS